MFSLILRRLSSNVSCIKIADNLTTKLPKRFNSWNFEEINIKTNNCFQLNPLVMESVVKDIDRQNHQILDKWDSNKFYVLITPTFKSSIIQINPILFPDFSSLRVNQKNRKIVENEIESKEIKEPENKEMNKMYCDYRIIRDPRSYTHLTIIRRHKMNKHKRDKWRKKMLAFIKKKFLKRNIRKEKLFRAELLAQIKEAEDFDAEKYVRTILETIDSVPKPETHEQKIQKIRDLIRKNRRETNLISPKFDE